MSIFNIVLGAVSQTYLSILKKGFTLIFSSTQKSVSPSRNWRNFSFKFRQVQTVNNFSHSVNMVATYNVILWKCECKIYS